MKPNILTTTPTVLTVYKASAGSGKTFRLSVEYIKLLVADPLCARTILAVTFTNKATDEMKTRILSQLYGLWRRLPSSANYMERITEETDFAEHTVSERAGIALRDILHHYSYFRIQTIDTFFQGVLRNLARELDLTANLRIELNDRQVEQHAVDAMIEELQDNDEVLLWILDYIKDNIDEDRNWNVIGSIKRFGETIFKEFYKTHSARLNAAIHRPGFFADFNKRLRALRAQSQQLMADTAADVLNILDEHGLDIDDFSYGRGGIIGYFLKMADGAFDNGIVGKRVSDALTLRDPDKWAKKAGRTKEQVARVRQLAADTLIDKLVRAEELRQGAWRTYQSCTLTLRHIRQLYLLNSIEKRVRQTNAETNSFLLSDTQGLLHALIRDTDTPFIFEKIGTRIAHIMIDEFQDTSTVQWGNFLVLLRECMSHGLGGNLIVGDVKQSIYRWRNGDWRLLNNIEAQFPAATSPVSVVPLKTNYRSLSRVIRFNNAFFNAAKDIEFARQQAGGVPDAEQLQRAYADVAQDVPEGKPDTGYVSVALLPREDYEAETLARLADTVHRLLAMGERQQDIAIIVRDNATIQLIADHFMNHCPDVSIISDEAFRLGKSLAVNVIVAALRLLVHPDELPTKAFLAKAYQKHILHRDFDLSSVEQLDAMLPDDYALHTETLRATPLYELAERLFAVFRLDTLSGQSSYLHTFLDHLSDYILANTTDIEGFVDEWDSRLQNESTQADSLGGVRLLTIHKSKGLEYDNVLLPFCDWDVDKGDIVWCSPQEAPYNELPLVPIDFAADKMQGTVYEHDCKEEQLQNCVDNLNLLYVAFTRASKRLFVLGRRGSTARRRSQLVEQSLAKLAETLPGSQVSGLQGGKDEPLSFAYGDIQIADGKAKADEGPANVFLPTVRNIRFDLRPNTPKAEFRQSNQSREFTRADGEGDQRQQSYIAAGNILHRLFSCIRTEADIDKAIRAMEADGTLQESGMTASQVASLVRKRVASPGAKDWFSGRWRLFNECTILAYDEARGECVEQRPDRVMTDGERVVIVDFKFGTPRNEYIDQVRRYMSLVRSMGNPRVEGYLWFVYTNKIVTVEA